MPNASIASDLILVCHPPVEYPCDRLPGMGVYRRSMSGFLCDGCGNEIIAEEGTSVDGFFIEVQRVKDSQTVIAENVYACSSVCVSEAVRGSLVRELLSEEEKNNELYMLRMRGHKSFHNEIPMLASAEATRPMGSTRALDPLNPDWKPE